MIIYPSTAALINCRAIMKMIVMCFTQSCLMEKRKSRKIIKSVKNKDDSKPKEGNQDGKKKVEEQKDRGEVA